MNEDNENDRDHRQFMSPGPSEPSRLPLRHVSGTRNPSHSDFIGTKDERNAQHNTET